MPRRPEPDHAEYDGHEHTHEKGNPWSRWTPNWLPRKASNTPAPKHEKLTEESVNIHPTASHPTSPKPVALGLGKLASGQQGTEAEERLCRLEVCQHPRRAVPKGRRKRAVSASADSRSKTPIPRGSFPDIRAIHNGAASTAGDVEGFGPSRSNRASTEQGEGGYDIARRPSNTPPLSDTEPVAPFPEGTDALLDAAFWEKLEAEWVLCLSMHFRDGSDREKFFVTYIEHRNQWRRVTVSCDYRSAPEDSLERDLKSLHYQRDKNARVYQAIQDSLPDIQFYDTVTNLKLQTIEGRLHVHVTEDVNEITQYPPIAAIQHLRFEQHGYLEIRESDLLFESHLSGFVYKVSNGGNIYIKKEISSPDTIDEFLYELNALAALRKSEGVIGLVGVVVDDDRTCIKGLLIEWASGGSLNDVLFETQDRLLPWPRRIKWAKQIVAGIADIHEAGFIQGDCTISNIVLDANDNAKIVDINRRGCPIGWEPPEFEGLIRSALRVSMYIGVKSDLFQLGMILWAIANQADEPEREERPLRLNSLEIPQLLQAIVRSCLADDPTDRMSAKELLKQFDVLGYGSSDPVFVLQDTLLAGMVPFEEKSGSTKTSDTPVDNDTPFGGPNHQDSGLDFVLADDESDSQADDRLHQFFRSKFDSPHILLPAKVTPGLPVHQDSGFADSAFTELQTRGFVSAPFSATTHDQSDTLIGPASGSYPVTGDILEGVEAHPSVEYVTSDIPRFDTPPPIS